MVKIGSNVAIAVLPASPSAVALGSVGMLSSGGSMEDVTDGWETISLDSSLETSPSSPVASPVLNAPMLPFELLDWQDFERLQWRVLRDVEGLRHGRLYGKRGQAQHGLDIVALAPDGGGVALQSKRYSSFSAADLDAAVEKFSTTKRPFEVHRFIVGVAAETDTTKVVQGLARHQRALRPLEFDLWGKEHLSEMLREQPEIVIQFFGEPTAHAFCLPFTLRDRDVSPRDAVAVREALGRTPEESTGAAAKFRLADAESDPERALLLVEEGQQLLRDAHFKPHAAEREEQRGDLLLKLGRVEEAARGVLNEFWAALDRGRTTNADMLSHRLQKLIADVPADHRARGLAEAANVAVGLSHNPLGHVPALSFESLGDLEDQVRLAVLAGETAIANDRLDWVRGNLATLAALSEHLQVDLLLRVRLRLVMAEATEDWSSILEDARKKRLGHDVGSLVTARYARNRAILGEFQEADALWEEAAGDACLAKRWADASTWVFSRRAFRTRWRLTARDSLLSIEIALGEMGPSESILASDVNAYTSALESLRLQKLRPAAIAAQRALRQAIAVGDWVGEDRVRGVLGAIYAASGEPDLAAHHYARGSDTSEMKELGVAFAGRYIDVVDSLRATNYWTVGTAYRLIAAEADLVPDSALSGIAVLILDELAGAEAGTLSDARAFTSSRYLGAVKALAGLADRLSEEQAQLVLAHFERQPPVEPNHYRHHDEDEAIAVARIALSHQSLSERAVDHLVPLLVRSQSARGEVTIRATDAASDIALHRLEEAAANGNHWAHEMLAARDDAEAPPPDVVETAFKRLSTPLQHASGVRTVGTNAVGDSLLLLALPPARREAVITELIQRATEPVVALTDRGEYLIAASNLVDGIGPEARRESFTEAMRIATDPSPPEPGLFGAESTHPLGSFRMETGVDNTHSKALFLAARLAGDDGERAVVKNRAFALLGKGDATDYWPTRVLQRLGHALDDDLGFLAGLGWAPRSLAALRWVASPIPPHLGLLLATDVDVRVRRALASELASATALPEHDAVRDVLAEDQAYSVRSLVQPRGGPNHV